MPVFVHTTALWFSDVAIAGQLTPIRAEIRKSTDAEDAVGRSWKGLRQSPTRCLALVLPAQPSEVSRLVLLEPWLGEFSG